MTRLRSIAFLCLTAPVLAGLGCATPPKPPELDAFEALRKNPGVEAARKKSPSLMGSADNFYKRAHEEWQSNELPKARRDALMGQIKLKHAIAMLEQDQAKNRIVSANADLAKSEEERERLEHELTALNEQVALLKRLGDERAKADDERKKMTEAMAQQKESAEAEKQKLAQQLSAEQVRTAASDKIKAAQLALKTAETVEANVYATALYMTAADMLGRAEKELAAGDYGAAGTSADLAHQKADESARSAKPAYEAAGQAAANKTRDRALESDAAGVPGVTVSLERKGDVQRLVLRLTDFFSKKDTGLAPGHEATLDAVASLMKKYPSYPVQLTGYTDNKGKPDILLALSMARANSIFSALVTRGVDPKRMIVSGQGGADAIADNKHTAGRSKNNRVELVFLYH